MWKEYYENTQLKTEGKYGYFGKEGVWKEYYENGELKAEYIYKDNKLKKEIFYDKNN